MPALDHAMDSTLIIVKKCILNYSCRTGEQVCVCAPRSFQLGALSQKVSSVWELKKRPKKAKDQRYLSNSSNDVLE